MAEILLEIAPHVFDGRLGWKLSPHLDLSRCYSNHHYKSNNTGHYEMGYKHVTLEDTTLKKTKKICPNHAIC
jgi:hypothetical protein